MKHKRIGMGDKVMLKFYHDLPNVSSNAYKEIPGIVIAKGCDTANDIWFYSVRTDDWQVFYDVPETRIRVIENTDMSKITNVKFNGPATIVFWGDGTKTIVKAHDEEFDPEKGLAMAIAKKALGNNGHYFNEIKKWLPEEAVNALSKCF